MVFLPRSCRNPLLLIALIAALPSAAALHGCALAEHRVEFEEMGMPPRVVITDDSLIVHTTNSRVNSALSIYHIDVEVEEEAVVLSAYQIITDAYRDRFTFPLSDLDRSRAELLDARWVWEDEDGTRVELVEVEGGIASEGEGVE